MWVFLNDAFLSIVNDRDSDGLLVRARLEGDLERAFPGCTVQETPAADYRWRARISRLTVREMLTERIRDLDYPNFKNSVQDNDRHDAYFDVWSAMHGAQTRQAGLGFCGECGEPIVAGVLRCRTCGAAFAGPDAQEQLNLGVELRDNKLGFDVT